MSHQGKGRVICTQVRWGAVTDPKADLGGSFLWVGELMGTCITYVLNRARLIGRAVEGDLGRGWVELVAW